ncbi:hypothetical protein [Streptomyces sp. NPDC006925]|uniref:hypothetical protein n=1 Tax=Streptomyces sp. NPDC006925 TaxID=3364768 RepID=UPI0036737854
METDHLQRQITDHTGNRGLAGQLKEWFDTLFPQTSVRRTRRPQQPSADSTSSAAIDSGGDTVELAEEVPESALARMTRLRAELASLVASSTLNAVAVAGEINQLLETVEGAVRAREASGAPEEPAEVQKLYMREFAEIKADTGKIGPLLDKAALAVMSL